ncbi:hypothetical protein DKX38_023619 [Salix brachista]|uniref:Uncharacterized protein n=1 Tax=Salix brachista TaxID=2182728 RepID=A0A5N5JPD8_9ROSI|nr:hypothetical protein DKX38_023619 [Salix brachista]
MLHLESPAGVGFSYSANESLYNSVTDEITGSALLKITRNSMAADRKSTMVPMKFSPQFVTSPKSGDNMQVALYPSLALQNVDDETFKYLNRKYVQEALHAQLAGVDPWTICSDVLKYEMESPEIATVPLLAKLVRPGIRDHKVNGFAKGLGLNTTVPYRPGSRENRLLAGHKYMVIYYLLQPLEEHHMKLHFHSQRGSSFEALQAKELITGESAICLQVGDCCGRRQMDKMATAKFLAANFKMVAE